jgi:hypothetical protein
VFSVRRVLIGTFVSALLLGTFIVPVIPFAVGASEAIADASLGRWRVKHGGPWTQYERAYREVLLKEHGVEVDSGAGCMSFPVTVARMNGYNSVAEPLIELQIGSGVLDSTRERLRDNCLRRCDHSNGGDCLATTAPN